MIPASALAAPWAVHPGALPATLTGGDPAEIMAGVGGRSVAVAEVHVRGLLMPRPSGWGTVGVDAVADAVESCAGADAILMRIDSPGGSAAGVPEAAARIAAVAETTPVVALAEHMAASGAYWLAAACSAVVASPSAVLGSVGVILQRVDLTAMRAETGAVVHTISAGAGKADTNPDTEFTDEARGRLQALVDASYAAFVADVARGRGVSPAAVRDSWGASLLDARSAVAAGMASHVMAYPAVRSRVSSHQGRRSITADTALSGIVAEVSTTQSGRDSLISSLIGGE